MIGVAIELILADHELGIVVGYRKQVSKFTVDGLLVIQAKSNLDIYTFVVALANKVDLRGVENANLNIITQAEYVAISPESKSAYYSYDYNNSY